MKIVLKLIVTGMCLYFISCADAGKVPAKIIAKQKMSAILIDMSLADAYGNDATAETMRLPDSLRQEKIKVYYKQILNLHQVSVPEFTSSYAWYEEHPDRLREVFEIVQAEISKMKSKLGDPADENAPIKYRLKRLFPYAEKVIALPGADTIRPFVKRLP
ncbi:MAG TPA: DUF4296 domain-containing protein [Chitinophaga sp.]|uniref:DUF4296 domain-containing protein n=1 Tax=Chitinophaga sp. TaxID=1869181 RepID=UPI002BF0A5E5|nr:DUF4296 domain-containing protein [Chitinophaga sp.]HVI46550.1 DUF4296 domain-containing protein [Chitinophaga sp.]